jgi:hypothetical protein
MVDADQGHDKVSRQNFSRDPVSQSNGFPSPFETVAFQLKCEILQLGARFTSTVTAKACTTYAVTRLHNRKAKVFDTTEGVRLAQKLKVPLPP